LPEAGLRAAPQGDLLTPEGEVRGE